MNATKNLSIANNADFTFSMVYQDADEQPIDLTGTSIKMQIKEKPGGTTYWTGTAGSGLTVTPLEGRIDIHIPAATTSAFTFQSAVYDVVITWSDTTKERLIGGTVKLIQGVTV